MSSTKKKLQRAVAATIITGCLGVQAVDAATSTWTGGGAIASFTQNTGNPTQTTVNYLTWDNVDGTNWGGTPYTIGDAAVFNAASGTFVIKPVNNTMDPSSMTFDGGATYDFPRGSTTAGNNSWGGFNTTGVAGPDSLITQTPYGPANNTSISTASTFTGKVIIRSRMSANPGWAGTINLSGGTVEIQDAGALPGTTVNNPPVSLSGGELAINTNGNPLAYTYRQGNINPSTSQMAGALTVTANSKLSNTAVDAYGRAREMGNMWNGTISVAPNTTLTINTGGGALIGNNVSGATLAGTGTILIGTASASSAGANRLRLNGNLATGVNTLRFDLGDTGILDTGVAAGSTANIGAITSAAGTVLRGSSGAGGGTNAAAATLATSSATLSIGNAGASDTIGGVITNGSGASVGGGISAGVPPLAGRAVLNANVTKVGAGTLTLATANYYNGATTVAANGGKISVGNVHALGDGSEAVTVNTGGAIDLNGRTPGAGKVYTLSGGSLINDNIFSSSTISSGASVTLRGNTGTGGNGGTGAWKGGDAASLNANAGQTPTVTVSAPNVGSDQATAHPVMQLGWIRFSAADGGAIGSGYLTEPKITFSDPDLPASLGGRPIKVVATLSNNTAGQVASLTVIDPGFGYTSIPTITIDNTGTGGSGFLPTWYMTAGSMVMDNGGSGYTAAPTFTFNPTAGYLANSTNPFAGFGQVTLAASTTSNIGGAGNLNVNAPIAGTGNLVKVGTGTVVLNSTSTYNGTTAVNEGVLKVNGSANSSAFTVAANATLGGSGSVGSVLVNSTGTLAPGSSIESLDVASLTLNGTLQVEYGDNLTPAIDVVNVAGSLDLSGTSVVDFQQVGSTLNGAAYIFATYGSRNGMFNSVLNKPLNYEIDYNYNSTNVIALVLTAVPEAGSFLAVGLVGAVTLAVRRIRRRA